MRIVMICTAAVLGLTAARPCAADPVATGAPPTAQVTAAENSMAKADNRGGLKMLLTPGAKIPDAGPDASALDYARQAKISLELGRTGDAELALEWAQARFRVDEEKQALAEHKSPPPYDSECKRNLCQAMLSIGHGDLAAGRTFINTAIDEMVKTSGQAGH
jgi:hypothetical protein